MAAQHFGGQWSLIKLDRVERYLKAFTTALKNQPFKRVYIDAFAGTGSFEYAQEALPLFSEAAAIKEQAGSAVRAALIDPPFDTLYFIDTPKKVKALKATLGLRVRDRATFFAGNANEHVLSICRELPVNARGVIFLDPFGMNVEWTTLQAVRRTLALDVWYLFPLMGAARQAAFDFEKVDAPKARALTRILGTDAWREHFYEQAPPPAPDLFQMPAPAVQPIRGLTVYGIDRFVQQRLRDEFPYVADPIHLGPNNVPLFSLFFAVSNPSPKARTLAAKIAESILRPKV